jgi:four helix bundle protein
MQSSPGSFSSRDDQNDEARMPNDEGMTKSKNASRDDDPFADDGEMQVVREEPGAKRVYDLEERTARFGEAVIDFAKTIPQNAVTDRLISQLVGAATSIGANYVEADDAVSKKEFLKNIGTCRKEARETKHYLRMIVRAVPELRPEARKLWMEAKELNLIFSKIWRNK